MKTFLKRSGLFLVLITFFSSSAIVMADDAFSEFKDVKSSHPNYKAIMYLKTKNIIDGYADNTFKPDQIVNRAEALKMIMTSLNVPKVSIDKIPNFKDVDTKVWYSSYVYQAYNMKIVNGYSDGTFRPAQTLSLVENLKILLEAGANTYPDAIKIATVNVTSNPYADAMRNQWYSKYVQFAKDNQLIDSDRLNKIYPSQGMTRGKLAELIYRLLLVVDKKNTGNVVIKISNMKFTPSTLTINKGQTVKWVNNDSVVHEIMEKQRTGDSVLFESSRLARGAGFEYTFNDTGVYEYYCVVHPEMTGKIIVQ